MTLSLKPAGMGEMSRLHGESEEGGAQQQGAGVSPGCYYCSRSPQSYCYHLKCMPNLKLSTRILKSFR